MSEAKFPRRFSDGSFCIDVVIDGATEPVSIRDWIENAWMPTNDVWERDWSGGKTEVLRYSDEFAAPPEVHSAGGSGMLIRLKGASTSTALWRDWLVRLCGDLTTRWSDLKVREVLNSP